MKNFLASAALTALLFGVVGAPRRAMADPPTTAVREANQAMARADRAAVRLLALLDQSRRQRNLAQIACVDDQLSQVNSFSRILSMRAVRVRTALADGSTRDLAHERRVIRRLAENVQRAARAGRACVYAAAGEGDWTRVEVIVSPEIRHQDLTPRRLRRD